MGLSGRSYGGLDPTLQADATRRLGSLAGLLGILFIFTTVLRNVVHQFDDGFGDHELLVANVFSGTFSVTSFAIYFYARRTTKYRRALRVGLAYELATCLSVALLESWLNDLTVGGVRLSLITIFLMVFPVAVPARPRVRILTTALCFLTLPFSLWLAQMLGRPVEHIEFLLLPTFIAAVGALAVSQIVHGLAVQLQQARTLGAYELVEKLGEGGMGEVWLGKHQMLARPAAIKLVTADSVGAQGEVAIRRFEREAQATSVLRSPHTIELYDFGISEDGTFYYVMELLEGCDLETLVEEHGPIAPGRVVHILRQACRSLTDAHRHRLVHRDIKPANIFLCRLGTELDFVKVLDFGLVKPESGVETGPNDVKLSAENSIAGTPAYMAPEIALSGDVGHSADLYALGCVGYFLLTGELVFTGNTPMLVALKHVKDEPSPPSERSEVDVPAPLETLILACLSKTPEGRPESAAALEALLAEIARDLPWTAADAEQWWEAHMPELMIAPAPGVSTSLAP